MVKGQFRGFFGKLTKCSLAIRPAKEVRSHFFPFILSLRKDNFLDKVGGFLAPPRLNRYN